MWLNPQFGQKGYAALRANDPYDQNDRYFRITLGTFLVVVIDPATNDFVSLCADLCFRVRMNRLSNTNSATSTHSCAH